MIGLGINLACISIGLGCGFAVGMLVGFWLGVA